MRIMIHGGYWKNTEDEILKAAVMKYGLNQWARISSLSSRKSAKQCKARWYEWLDPSIKKTEWSQEEDEKLLHLAKILPTQWRTIAPIVGRTAAQCLERYEYLLDTAQHKLQMNSNENVSNHPSEYDDPRRLRPGEIDPHPETKPARPDPIDMDEDEKEMLSEARARLANTKGKKAKRKAREKQLEHARRLATLQKKRELKAAGIHVNKRKHKHWKYLDYNLEIPFYRKAPRGFYDTTADDKRAAQLTKEARTNFKPMFITEIEGERRDVIEERERKKDIARQKLLRKSNLPEAIMRLNRMNDPINTNSSMNRKKQMYLPMPQISEQELEDIAKITQKAHENAEQSASGSSITAQLTAGLYQNNTNIDTNVIQQQRSTRTPSNRSNHILEQASNAYQMLNSETPLHGGSNAQLIGNQDWNGITPKQSVIRTPNPLSTPIISDQTPKSQGIRTPSYLGLHTPQSILMSSANQTPNTDAITIANQTFAQNRREMKRIRKRIHHQLSTLPPPNNEYEIALPPMPKKPFAITTDFVIIEDQFDTDIRIGQQMENRNIELFQKQSQAIQRNLPLPKHLYLETEQYFNGKSVEYNDASHLIHSEMLSMLFVDHKNEQCFNEPPKKRRKVMSAKIKRREEFDLKELEIAAQMIESEMQNISEQGNSALDDHMFGRVHNACVFVPRLQRYAFVANNKRCLTVKLNAKKQEFNLLRKNVEQYIAKCDKKEQHLDIKCKGYRIIEGKMCKTIGDNHEKILECNDQISNYQILLERETLAIPQRLKYYQKLISKEKEREKGLQKEFEQRQEEYQKQL